MIDAFNKHREKTVIPGEYLCVDESFSSWQGKDGKYCMEGLPHVSKEPRKPRGVGTELKGVADGESGVMLFIEINEGKESTTPSYIKYKNKYKNHTALTLRMVENWRGSRRVVCADSWFASVSTAVALKKDFGLYFIGMVKTAYSLYPKKFMEKKSLERGESVTLTTTVDGVKLLAHKWQDKKAKTWIATCGTTTPGSDAVKKRSRIEIEDDDEITISYEKRVPRTKLAEQYFNVSHDHKIDVHNHYRQGGIALEEIKTNSWRWRLLFTVFGIIETDAYLAYCLTLKRKGMEPVSHSAFTQGLAAQLMTNTIDEVATRANARQRKHQLSEMKHELVSLSEHPLYVEHKLKSRTVKRRCRICRAKTAWMCKDCSTHEPFALCNSASRRDKLVHKCLIEHKNRFTD